MQRFLIGLVALPLLTGCVIIDAENASVTTQQTVDQSGAQSAVVDVLNQQNAAWNDGDIDAFMEGYWKSDQLRFGSGGTITYGWDATNERYKTRYTDRAAMGRLVFSDLDVHVYAEDAAIVHGRWALEREADKPSGLFTLVFRDFGDGWVIVSDTTTSAG